MKAQTRLDDNMYDEVMGRDVLPTNYTSTGVLGQMALAALSSRLGRDYNQQQQPFSLSVHFNAPHPPIVTTYQFANYYYERRNQLHVEPSIDDKMVDSFYVDSNG